LLHKATCASSPTRKLRQRRDVRRDPSCLIFERFLDNGHYTWPLRDQQVAGNAIKQLQITRVVTVNCSGNRKFHCFPVFPINVFDRSNCTAPMRRRSNRDRKSAKMREATRRQRQSATPKVDARSEPWINGRAVEAILLIFSVYD
jgi:hypothetical protein